MLKQFRALVSPQIFLRGEHYYRENRIKAYRLRLLDVNQYLIRANVLGSKSYLVEILLDLNKGLLQYEGSCSCPNDWQGICKHQVAVMLYFFEQTFAIKNNRPSLTDFERLLKVIELPELTPVTLHYRIKGLLQQKMVNFSFTLLSAELSEADLERIIQYVSDKEEDRSLPDYGVKTPLTEESMQVIEFLRHAKTRASRMPGTVLIPKSHGNFAFIFNLVKYAEVFCQETGQRLKVGKSLQPEVSIRGTEDGISFHLSAEHFEICASRNAGDPFWWTVIDDTLSPVHMRDFENLPSSIRISEEKKGQFLFEILPELQHRFSAKLSESLRGYELVRTYPEIGITLDFREGEIICDAQIRINDREIRGTQTLDLPLEEGQYRRSEENPKVWYGVDRASIQEYIRFLEENEFVISRGRFVIKDQEDIQNFITGGFLHLPEDWQVRTTEAFEQLEVIPAELEPVVEVSTDGRIDWFDFQIRYHLGGETFTHEEILARLRRNSQGENFIQIGNKYYVIYNDAKARLIDETVRSAQRSERGYETRFFNLLYYRNLFKEKGISMQGDRIYNELEEEITDQRLVQQWELPGEVETVLRNYQKTGFYWMRFLHKYHLGGILADDMGLGKTVQVLTLIKSVSSARPSLVICPRTLLYNWAAEIEKFFPSMRYLIYYGNPTEREELGKQFAGYDLIITTYSIVSRDIELLEDKAFAYCILDEAQQIKNFRSKRAESVKNIMADHRLVLTGTPIENSLDELWSLFDFLMTGYLGTHSAFRTKYVAPIRERNDSKLLGEIKRRVAPFILRRTKREVLIELPEKTEQVTRVEMTRLQSDIYQTILQQVREEVLTSVKQFGFNRSHITVLAALTRLRQVCNHPQMILKDLDEDVTSGKIEVLLDLVNEAVAGGHKLLIFSQFVKMLRIIEEEFKKAGYTYEYLDGSTKNRMERVNRFNEDPSINAFLISLKAGGTGLNLTGADIVIHIDPWWNPMVENQATDRAHRIGQVNKVLVYKLITAGTVEEKMLRLQERKRNIFDAVIEQNNEVIENLTWEDVQELFSI